MVVTELLNDIVSLQSMNRESSLSEPRYDYGSQESQLDCICFLSEFMNSLC